MLASTGPTAQAEATSVEVPQHVRFPEQGAEETSSQPPVFFHHAGHFFGGRIAFGGRTAVGSGIACGSCHPGVVAASPMDEDAFEIRGPSPTTIHAACIGCHERTREHQTASTAPLTCGSCHLADAAPAPEHPALGLPVRVRLTAPDPSEKVSGWIDGVDFPHLAHADSIACRVCHHIEPIRPDRALVVFACSECHDSADVEDPSGYYRTIHGDDPKSCIGCHRASGGLAGNDVPPLSCTASCHEQGETS
jgi:hypothetical protein